VFFSEQTVESVADGIRRFEEHEGELIPAEIQRHARQFDTSVFMNKISQFIDDAMRRE
jgi:hypothetical protein